MLYNLLIENKSIIAEGILWLACVLLVLFVLCIILDLANKFISKIPIAKKCYEIALGFVDSFAGQTLRDWEINIANSFINLFTRLYKCSTKFLSIPMKMVKIEYSDSFMEKFYSVCFLLCPVTIAAIIFQLGFNKITVSIIIMLTLLITAAVVTAAVATARVVEIVEIVLLPIVAFAVAVVFTGTAAAVAAMARARVVSANAVEIIAVTTALVLMLASVLVLGIGLVDVVVLTVVFGHFACLFLYLQKLAGVGVWLSLIYTIWIILIIGLLGLISEKKQYEWIRLLLVTIAMSITYSLIALIIINYAIPDSFTDNLNAFWFIQVDELIQTTQWGNSLLVWNFPFDFATIIITIYLLKHLVIERKWPISLIAIVDIAISAILTILLYAFLKTIENGWHISAFFGCLVDSWNWFIQIIYTVFSGTSEHFGTLSDIHLLPLILSTFIPVASYMIILFFISSGKVSLKVITALLKICNLKEDNKFALTKAMGIISGGFASIGGLLELGITVAGLGKQ